MVIFGYTRKNEVFVEDNDDEEYVWRCSGSLISDLYVLSAAHCNKEDDPIIYALLGISKILDYKYKEVRKIDSKYTAIDGKLLLVKLQESVVFTEHILPLCLRPRKTKIRNGTTMTEIGWPQPNTTQNNPLRKVEFTAKLSLWCNDNCRTISRKGNQASCIGKSG